MSTTPQIGFLRDRLGHSVAYAEHGEGPLVICPSWWVSHVEKDWRHDSFRRFFERLGRGMRVVRYDRPGVGLSDRDVGRRTVEDEVALLDDIADRFGEPRYALFAVSCAGPISIRHAVEHPDRVSRICFYGSFLNGEDICTPEVQQAVCAVVRAHWGIGSRALADIFFPEASRETLDAFSSQTRDAASAEAAADLLNLTYAMRAADAVDALPQPALVIHRNGDRAIPFAAGRILASRLPQARLVTLDGSAHPPWLGGDEIADLANGFLSEGELRSPAQTAASPPADCQFDEANRCLRIEGREVALTPLEFGVMRALASEERQVVSRDVLLERVWNQPFEGSNRIDVVISALRRKLGPWSASIETVTGHGYRFNRWQRRA